MHNLSEIFNEALEDPRSIVTLQKSNESVITKGCKIQRFTDRIEILNMGRGGDYFKLCSEEEYEFFYLDGWKIGVIKLALSTCLHKLKIIEQRIKQEVNTRKNDKHIQNLKNRREVIMIKYASHKQKLNQIKSIKNGKTELF
tara:strand:+ start:166 stop:591 length:426 start_codon:yes stop_codon:yes gene_type:complete